MKRLGNDCESQGTASRDCAYQKQTKVIRNASSARHGLMLLWFADLINVTEEVTIHRPNVSTPLSTAFIRGDLNDDEGTRQECRNVGSMNCNFFGYIH